MQNYLHPVLFLSETFLYDRTRKKLWDNVIVFKPEHGRFINVSPQPPPSLCDQNYHVNL
jgi:hypothetical protein